MHNQHPAGVKANAIASYSIFFLLGIFFLFAWGSAACNGKSKTTSPDSIDIEKPFFPVDAYFKSEIENADASDSIFMKLSSNGKTIDSATITAAQLNELAAPFTEHNIADPSMKELYKQDIFLDLSTNSYSFTYSAKSEMLPIQYLHVLVDTITETARRVFINERLHKNDTTVTRKMGWKTGEGFYINTIFQIPDRPDSVTQLSVKWMK